MSISGSLSAKLSFISILLFLTYVVPQIIEQNTFTEYNSGDFGEQGRQGLQFKTEYDVDYRVISFFWRYPFTLCFYRMRATPDEWFFAIREGYPGNIGSPGSDSTMYWIWEANRDNPVGEDAYLMFQNDGNLVLYEADGRIVWQTNTANKGVVDWSILQNGNLVLLDEQGQYVWQSFDHPTNTLLRGQPLVRSGTNNKIVSRVSDNDASEGPYSLVLEKDRVALYLKSNNSPIPVPYFAFQKKNLQNFSLELEDNNVNGLAFDLDGVKYGLNQTGYDNTFSFLRLGSDGNLKVYSHTSGKSFGWEDAYLVISRNGLVSECQLPTKCGSLGICDQNECVACPTPRGLKPWSPNTTCDAPMLPPCLQRAGKATYYKVVGVRHFSSEYRKAKGPMKLSQCREMCDKDCGCVAFFYRKKTSKCLLAPVLGTLTKVRSSSQLGYIKIAK